MSIFFTDNRANYNHFDIDTSQLQPYPISLWLEQQASFIPSHVHDPASSWKTQKKIKKIFTNQLPKNDKSSTNQLVCIQIGYKNQDEAYMPPQFKVTTLQERDTYPQYLGVAFASQDLIDEVQKYPVSIDFATICTLVSFLNTSSIPWEVDLDGCDHRAEFTYQILIAMGVPSERITKHYCYGGQDERIGKKSWLYHVAVSIEDDENKKWVLDLSIDPMPIELDNWIEALTSKRPIVHKTLAEVPFQQIPGICSVVSVSGRVYLDKEGSDVIQVIKPDHFLGKLAGYRIDSIIARYPLLAAISGEHFVSSLHTSRIRSSEEIDHTIALQRLMYFAKDKSGIPPTCQDIDALLSSAILPKEDINQLFKNHLDFPQDYPLSYVRRNAKDILRYGENYLNKDLIPQLHLCLAHLKARNFSEKQLIKMEHAIKAKIEALQAASAEFAQEILAKIEILTS